MDDYEKVSWTLLTISVDDSRRVQLTTNPDWRYFILLTFFHSPVVEFCGYRYAHCHLIIYNC